MDYQLNNKVFLYTQIACFIFAIYGAYKFSELVPHGGGANKNYETLMQSYTNTINGRTTRWSGKQPDSPTHDTRGNPFPQWQRVSFHFPAPVLPLFSRTLNVGAIASTEIPRAMYDVFAPNFNYEAFSGWHPAMGKHFLKYLQYKGSNTSKTNEPYYKMLWLPVDLSDPLVPEILSLVGSKTKRAFLTPNVIKLDSLTEERRYLNSILSRGGVLANQITTSDPKFDLKMPIVSPNLATIDQGLKSENHRDYSLIFVKDQPEHIVFSVETTENTYLALMDLWAKGWKAYVDGQETNIYRGYIGTRFIELPSGKHRVEFKYSIVGFQTSLILSILTWVGLFGAGIMCFYLRSPSKSLNADL